jgi:hypothetical protein
VVLVAVLELQTARLLERQAQLTRVMQVALMFGKAQTTTQVVAVVVVLVRLVLLERHQAVLLQVVMEATE